VKSRSISTAGRQEVEIDALPHPSLPSREDFFIANTNHQPTINHQPSTINYEASPKQLLASLHTQTTHITQQKPSTSPSE